MFIGHLPAGYLLSRVFSDRATQAAVTVGSILPDIDLLYFYTLGERAVVHHYYWTHIPAFWVVLGAVVWSILRIARLRYHAYVAPLLLGVFLHLCLDSIAGSIFWMYPFSDTALTLVHVPALYDPWYLNFIWHWTFAVEIAVVLFAVYIFVRRQFRKTVLSNTR